MECTKGGSLRIGPRPDVCVGSQMRRIAPVGHNIGNRGGAALLVKDIQGRLVR
jgi:hypothetical protein